MKSLHGFLLVAMLEVFCSTAGASPIRADLELDPTAYALSGNSIHVGIAIHHLRVDLGNFALAIPQFVHGDDGFDIDFAGFGAKLQYFLRANQTGAFGGVDASLLRVTARRQGTDLCVRDVAFQTGVHLGYRITLPAQFYVAPWLGVGYIWSARDVTLDGKTYAAPTLSLFPAVHVGYRF
jgi:hypothetical protein